MGGKNVRTPEQQTQLENALFPIIEQLVKMIFPDSKITQSEIKEGHGKILKIHVNQLETDEILFLANLVEERRVIVCLKRSGIGITIVINWKEETGSTPGVTV